jgi:hypothetical protein
MSGFATFITLVGIVLTLRFALGCWYWYANSKASFRGKGTKFFLGQKVYYMQNNTIMSDKIGVIKTKEELPHGLDNPSNTEYYLGVDNTGSDKERVYSDYNLFATKKEVIKDLNKIV